MCVWVGMMKRGDVTIGGVLRACLAAVLDFGVITSIIRLQLPFHRERLLPFWGNGFLLHVRYASACAVGLAVYWECPGWLDVTVDNQCPVL